MDKKMKRNLETLAVFIEVYCKAHHSERQAVIPKVSPSEVLGTKTRLLCAGCNKLLAHAIVKRTHCPMDPKPACKHCPNHCYYPTYREKIREVMRFSGRRLVLSGRVDYLLHLFF